ncbi:cytochrome BD ubiquinol oxidase subunit II [Alcanivorax sp. HI0033]|nr:cytochrome BD ubiquinol oxidase subunit II [Alcanivorax sp. HI0003]KZX72960.1 cytochrome BD ubiquinol oxidase subunit II [Alcanivorax sp. HI0007]KZX81307.1 cytochrome BD ubiquinol oxidase subunit II [Alcanivorax sp. HI0011]KZX87539.1 cytochrome BD ubiquinol oxidase subunit II [Alcanivorax sp. HI0013]KZY05789.1 cytochrome BD ubiquinol oxidase subunit II [Alcanivorax sp. HI0033]KZY21008.1 cytochrome BD ubiquinol oxidase subunit II [Alcanivorax sp. HI0035]MEE3387631.1 cytochrome d ubiquinol o
MDLGYWLPLFFAGAMGLALLIYVILDGYDLGIGMLLPFASDDEKDVMVAAIGPFWDANETWIVLGVGILLIAFPQAHSIVLTSLYLPVTLMLMGLILRGVAFDFRVKAGDKHKAKWNRLFAFGSLVASLCQGWMLGAFVTGLTGDATSTLFAALIALALPALYIMLGAAWLLIKTEGELFNKAVRWGRMAVLPMGGFLLLISIATPLVSSAIADKWFTLPNAIGLMPIPIATALAYAGLIWVFNSKQILHNGYGWLAFVALMVMCVLASIGLAYSLFPDIVLGRISIWEAASATESLLFTFWGAIIALPMILAYTIFIYRVFRGKATHLSYE